jgi:DNA invertase Pin-like site-specific DNA recombinase
VAYLRVSTDEQARSGLGLEAQQRDVSLAARRLGLELVAVESDPGVSGTKPAAERPGFMACMALLAPGDVLLVAKRDRLGRDFVETTLLERRLNAKEIRVVSAAGEGTENDEPSSVFQRRIMDAMAELERAMISGRTKAALRSKKLRGERVGYVPFGFRATRAGKLVPDEAERQVIALIVTLHRERLSVREIEHELVRRGVLGRADRTIGKTVIHRLVKRNA